MNTGEEMKMKIEEKAEGLELLSEYRECIMGFAALWILFFHEWIQIFSDKPIIGNIEEYLKAIGFCGVDIFLLVSGIGLFFSMGKSNTISFYYKRFKRIFLPFISMAVIQAHFDHWWPEKFIKNVTGFNFYTESIYSFLWFVPAIATIYILFPWFYKLFVKFEQPVIFIATLLEIWLVLSLVFRETSRLDMYGFTNRIPIFLIGVYFGWRIKKGTTKIKGVEWLPIIGMLFLGGFLSYVNKWQDVYLLVPVSDCCVPNILMSISLALIIAKCFSLPSVSKFGKIVKRCLVAILAFYGSISLEFYCYQEWMGRKIVAKFTGFYPNWMINLVVLAIVTIVAYIANKCFGLFWKIVEKILGLEVV